MWPIKTYLFFFSFVGACTLSFVYPIVGIVNYMFVYQVNPNKTWWGSPLEPLGIRYAMTAAVCLIVGMVVSAQRVPKSRTILGDWLILVFIFTCLVLASGRFGAGQTEYTRMLLDKMVKMAIFLVCFVRMGATRTNFKIILWTLVAGSLVLGYDAYTAPRGDFFEGRLNFVGGVDFRESSGLGAHIAAMLPLLGVMVLATRQWRYKLVALTAGVLAVNTLVQCRTRSAFVGVAAGLAAALVMAPRTRRARIYAALTIGLVGAFSLTDAHFWRRMDTVLAPSEYGEDSTIQSRLELWAIAGEMFADHPLGVGVGQFREKLSNYNVGQRHAFKLPRRVTHNTYLLCLTELGVQGAVVFAMIIFLSLHKLHRCRSLADRSDNPVETRLFAYGCLLAMVSYLVAGLFTDRLYTESFWWILALPVCLERAVVREVEARELLPELLEDWRIADEESDLEFRPAFGASPGVLR